VYRKVLVPLDGTRESEKIIPILKRDLTPETEVILLQVVRPVKTQMEGGQIVLGSQSEEAASQEAAACLRSLAQEHFREGPAYRWEATVAESSSQGIIRVAEREKVDLIALYVRDCSGIAKIVKGNTSRAVVRKSKVPVRVFGPDVPAPAEVVTAQPLEIAEAMVAEAVVHPEAAVYEGLMAELSGMEDAACYRESARSRTAETPVSEDDMLQELRQGDIFRSLTPEQARFVASLGKVITIGEGDNVGEPDKGPATLYIILKGEADLMFHSPLGSIPVRVVGPGDTFPLAAILGEGVLITTGVALTDITALAIPAKDMAALLERRADIGMSVYRSAAQVFARRYTSTLTHLGVAAERELRGVMAATAD